MKISHPFLRLFFLAFAAGAGWLVIWSFPSIMKTEDITSKIIALVVCVGLFGFFALYLLAWTFFYDRMENRERQRKADDERKERRKPAKEKLAEAKKEQRSERNANYILGAVAIATAIYFLTKNEWLMTGLMAVVAVYLFYKAARNIEPAKIKQKREEASRRQEVENLMETAKDDGAVIIVDHVDSLTAIEDAPSRLPARSTDIADVGTGWMGPATPRLVPLTQNEDSGRLDDADRRREWCYPCGNRQRMLLRG